MHIFDAILMKEKKVKSERNIVKTRYEREGRDEIEGGAEKN